ncbi:unnamed protein product [Pylaiella littoralis]
MEGVAVNAVGPSPPRAASTAQAVASSSSSAAAASATAPGTDIWAGDSQRCLGKTRSRRFVLTVAGIAAVCAAVLTLGLFFGLSSSSERGSSAFAQSTDGSFLGCFADMRSDRTMVLSLTDAADLTPDSCKTACSDGDNAYYALQYGRECWCGESGAVYDEFGDGECDYACTGDSTLNCGGYLANAVYEIGVSTGPISGCTTTSTMVFNPPDIRVEGGGCATLSGIYEAQSDAGYTDSDALLFVTDENSAVQEIGTLPTGFWLLASHLTVTEGSTLYVHGISSEGDADILRIQSNGEDDFYELRGHGGNLHFEGTTVTSWDTNQMEEQESYEGGRSFINCVSEVLGPDSETCDGIAKNDMGECRMDIISSVMGNLGWFDSESYGLTWKVRGFCKDLSNPDVFDRTNVYGDITDSEIYGMYYGMYTYGHQGGVWTNNIMRDNIQYGFDPHDDSDDVIIAYNTVYRNGNHGIIASKRCNNVEIYNNEVYDGAEDAVGIFLHRSSNLAKVYDNYVHDMEDAGMALMESMDADIHDNTIENVKWGVRLSVGAARNNIYDNTFHNCLQSGFYTYQGSDTPDESDEWGGRPRENIFTNNVISDTALGVDVNDGDENAFISNVFTGADALEFDNSLETTWSDNTLPAAACVEGDYEFTSDSDPPGEC